MTLSHWRLAAIGSALLLLAAIFLPIIQGPSIQGMLGSNPNLWLGYQPHSVGPQSWLATGRGEQIVFLLSALSCVIFAALSRFRALRWATLVNLALLLLGVVLTVGRMRRVVRMAELERSMAGEFGQMPSFLPPIVRWMPQWGLLFFVLGAVLLALATSQLVRLQEDGAPSGSPHVPARTPLFTALGTVVVAVLGLGFWQFRATQAPPQVTHRIPGFPPPGFPAPGLPTGRFPSAERVQTPQINGPATQQMLPALARGQFSRALFSPDGQFLAAEYGERWVIYPLKGASTPIKPMFSASLSQEPTPNRLNPAWSSPRSLCLYQSLAFVFDPQKKKWLRNESPAPLYSYVPEAALVQTGEQIERGGEEFVPTSHAVVWHLWDSRPQVKGNNNRIAITSAPDGRVFTLPAQLRLSNGVDGLVLSPRRPGGRLLAAHQTPLPASSQGMSRPTQLSVFDVTAGRQLWKKNLADEASRFLFSPDGRFLIGAGTPRFLRLDPRTTAIVNGRKVAVVQLPPSYNSTGLDIWDAATGQVRISLNEKGIDPQKAALNFPQNAVVYFKRGESGANSKARLVARAIPSGKLLARMEWSASGDLPEIAISPDGTQVALIEGQKINLLSWNLLKSGKGPIRVLQP